MTIPLASQHLSTILIHRIALLTTLFSALLSYNTCYIIPLSTGLELLGGLFQPTFLSQAHEILLSFIPIIVNYNSNNSESLQCRSYSTKNKSKKISYIESIRTAMARFHLFKDIVFFIGFLNIIEIYLITKLELKGKCGVYGFLCRTTGKLYVGSSKNLSLRFQDHIKGYRSNILLQNAINRYTLNDFVFILFEYCEPKDLISREQFYINSLSPEFNILQIAGSSLGYKHSEESLAKFSGENHPLFGKGHSTESITKMREAQRSIDRSGRNNPMFGRTGENHPMFGRTGENHPMFGRTGENNPMFGKSHSEEAIAKISAAKGGGTIYVYDTQGILISTFSSTRKAALHFKCSQTSIVNYLKNNKLFQDNWFLSFNKDKFSGSGVGSSNSEE